jgi:sortase A
MIGVIRRFLEIVFWLSGAFLVVFSVVTYSMAQSSSQTAINDFQSKLNQTELIDSSQDQHEHPILDQSLWSTERVAAYASILKEERIEPVGLLEIPGLGLIAPVYEGASEANMNRGLGRIKGTAKVGSRGNLGIAGHRDGFFRPLKDLTLNQTVLLSTANDVVEYRVESIDVVEPDNVEVLDPTDENSLTLVTCYPFYFVGNAPQRLIVKAIEI